VRLFGSFNLVALLGGLSAVTLIACVVVMTVHMDRREALAERSLLITRVTADLQASRASLAAWAQSDEAVRRLDHARDAAWAESTFPSLPKASILTYTFDHHNRFISGRHAPTKATGTLAGLEAALPDRMRAIRRHLRSKAGSREAAIDQVWSDGTLYMVVAAPFSPATASVRLAHVSAPLLVAVTPYSNFVATSLEGMGLSGLEIVRRKAAPNAYPIRNLRNEAVGWISWRQSRPGAELRRIVLWPTLLLVGAFIMLLAYAHGRALATQRAVLEGEARATHLALHDQLTELANRRALMQALEGAIMKVERGGGSLALLLVDLDRFKAVNDTYGHQCGDELIVETATRLRSACREDHDLCARLGGDEFVILASDCDLQRAEALALRVLERICQPAQLSSTLIRTGGSIGVAIFRPGHDSFSLLGRADRALYRAKYNGRSTYAIYDAETDGGNISTALAGGAGNQRLPANDMRQPTTAIG